MAGVRERVYLNDSKSHVRNKLDLQGKEKDEDFSTFEGICENVYQFKLFFDPQVMWNDLKPTLIPAQTMIKEKCQKENLRLGDMDTIMDDLSEWKLYQLHKAAKKKGNRSKKQAGNAAESSAHADDPSASTGSMVQ